MKWVLAAVASLPIFVNAASAQQSENRLRFAGSAPITTVDPYYTSYRQQIIFIGQLVWDTLIHRNPESGEYQPLLAKSWRWVDDVTLEFHLRDDVRWHDGRTFHAEDVAYTLNYVGNAANKVTVQSNVNWIAAAEVSGPSTVILKLKAPFPAALEYLASVVPILPEGFYGEGGVVKGEPVGTGPYKIANFVPGNSYDLQLSGLYFEGSPKGKPQIGSVSYRAIPDQAAAVAALMSGEVDWIYNVSRGQAEGLAASDAVSVLASPTMRIQFLSFNARQMEAGNPLADIRVREAVARAVNRDLIAGEVVGSGARVLASPCYHTQFGCKADVPQFPYDPAAAKKLLAEAGYADGFSFDMAAIRNREWAEAVAGSLAEIGVRANVQSLDYAAISDRINANGLHMWFGEWGSYSINDVSALYNNFFTLTPTDMVRDEELAASLKEAMTTADSARRKAIYDAATTRIASQIYWFPLWEQPTIYAFSKDLEFNAWPDENPRFYRVHWKQ